MRVDGEEMTSLAFDNMATRPITGTNDWQEYSLVLDLPAEAADITFGVLFQGAGKLWVDDLQFEIVGEDVPTTDMHAPMIKRQGKAAMNLAKEPRNLDFEK